MPRNRSSARVALLASVLVLCLGATAHPPAKKTPSPPKTPALADPESSDIISVPPASWPGFPLLPDGRFPIATYAGPPPLQTTDFRYAELAQTGVNVCMEALLDPGLREPNLQRIRVASRHNIWSFALDNRLIIPGRAYATGWRADVDSVVAAYSNEPGMLGYFLADEPKLEHYASFAALNRQLARRDPIHPGYVNFMPFPGPGVFYYPRMPYTSYLRHYLDQARPGFFAVDSYPLHKSSDFPYYVTGWDSVAYVSRQTATPFWAILLLSPYADLRVANVSEMAWQAFVPMAYGARGIMWFMYWTPAPTDPLHFHDGAITYDGRRTATFGRLTDVNARIQALGQEIGRWEWLGTRHVGTIPYGCRGFVQAQKLRIQASGPLTVGFFKQMSGQAYALFVNRNYKRVCSVKIFAPDTLLRWTRAPGLYRGLEATPEAGSSLIRNSLSLAPGDAELVRLPRSFDYLATQR
jgi:hypothetical protein